MAALPTGLGAGVGGLLGQLGDAMSAPRRMAWNAVGLPDTGEQLMTQLGMEPGTPITALLGMGAEMIGDPLTYVGGLAGKAGSMIGDATGSLSRRALQGGARERELLDGLLMGMNKGGMAKALPVAQEAPMGFLEKLLMSNALDDTIPIRLGGAAGFGLGGWMMGDDTVNRGGK